MAGVIQCGRRSRKDFGKIPSIVEIPNLIEVQKRSYETFLQKDITADRREDIGLQAVFKSVFPITDYNDNALLEFDSYHFGEPKYTVEECHDRGMTHAIPLKVTLRLVVYEQDKSARHRAVKDIKEQEVYLGELPLMTEKGTFIINGTERVVVSQLVRSPGVYFSRELDKTSDKDIYIAKIIPSRGAWLEFDVDKKDTVGVRIDRKRRQHVTVLLKALGWSTDEILELFDGAESIRNTLEKDHFETPEEALEDIYRKLRPGEPPTAESARTLLENLFFNPKRYDLAKVGRYKVGKKLGDEPLVDAMYRDGYLCPLCNQLMGETSETLATEYKIPREEQDAYALESHRRAAKAWDDGRFAREVVPVTVGEGKRAVTVARDEHIRADGSLEEMAKLKPVFKKDGSVTAGNASAITDGAAAILVLSEDAATRHGVKPQAALVGSVSVGMDPARMGLAPVPAVRKLLQRHQLTLDQIDVIELNEAFASQVLACDRVLRFEREKLNRNGGGIALGHPTGCSGARIMVPLLNELERGKGRYGIATLCVSGGQGMAVLVERV